MSNDTPPTPEIQPISIPLTKGYTALVSADDAELTAFKWQAAEGRYTVYVQRGVRNGTGKQKTVSLHRTILERMLGRPLKPGERCDHEDRNGLNCQRDNLRLATISQNNANRRVGRNNTSGYKGVQFINNRWEARIKVQGKAHYLGRYATPELAHEAQMIAARAHFGEFASDGIERKTGNV